MKYSGVPIRLIKILGLALIISAVFFLAHTYLLTDKSIKSLTYLLNNLETCDENKAQEILSGILAKEITKPGFDPDIYTGLAYSRDVLGKHKAGRSLEDVRIIIKEVIARKKEERSFSKKTKEEKHPIIQEYQGTLKARDLEDYKKTAALYLVLAEEYEDSLAAPMLLFQACATNIFDLGDTEKAYQIFKRIEEEYPTSRFALYNFSYSKPEYLKRDVKEAVPLETAEVFTTYREAVSGTRFPEEDLSKSFLQRIPVVNIILDKIEESMSKSSLDMALAIADYVNRRHLSVGDPVKIVQTEKFLNNFTRRRVNTFFKNIPIEFLVLSVQFEEDNRLKVLYTVKIGRFAYNGYARGHMSLQRIPDKWLTYTVEEIKIGPFSLPTKLVNSALTKTYKTFNENIPIDIENFEIDAVMKEFICEGFVREEMRVRAVDVPGKYDKRQVGLLKGKVR